MAGMNESEYHRFHNVSCDLLGNYAAIKAYIPTILQMFYS